MDGKLSVTDRQLLEDSLDEYRFYSEKIRQIECHILKYILFHFPEEYDLLLTIPGIK
ncbi:hypothetical protein ACO1PF_04825 [Alkalibacterium sp. f15]|uniref:hypothetical protein n=1 Tax=Alkalibacterium sp. f15 TaxID=3414029 RepID=UPI003BF7E10A